MTPELGSHIATTEPDTRGRFSLKKWIFRGDVETWRVYRSSDGRTITLEAVEQ